MPFGNGTGPQGYGPMTGRGAGYCAGYNTPGYMNPAWGRGRGRGRGWFGRGGGRGYRHWFYATGLPGWARAGYGGPAYGPADYPPGLENTAKDEMNILKDQARFLQDQLKDIQDRISTLEKAEVPKKQ